MINNIKNRISELAKSLNIKIDISEHSENVLDTFLEFNNSGIGLLIAESNDGDKPLYSAYKEHNNRHVVIGLFKENVDDAIISAIVSYVEATLNNFAKRNHG